MKMKVSDFVIKYLEDYGIKHIFMVAGGGCIHLVDSLSKSNIQYVCNLHEQGAGIAAEAYAQFNNTLGVALVTTGPGGTNIITPIAAAWLESTPMLVICGQVQRKDMSNGKVRQLGFQEIDMVNLTKDITKYSACVKDPDDIKYNLTKAINLATSGRPGPVLIEIPLDVQSQEIDIETLNEYEIIEKPVNISCAIKQVVNEINKAKRPIILVGNGVRLSGAANEFLKFINKTQIPVLTTWKAMDFIPEDHPLFVGRPGAIASRGANFNQQNADFILCIGARLDHGQTAYQHKYFALNAVKVIVDIDWKEIAKLNMNIQHRFNIDAYNFLKELNYQSDKINIDTKDWLKCCKETYLKYPVVLEEHLESSSPVNLYAFIDALSNVLMPGTTIVPGSSGACSEVTMQAFKVKEGQRILNTQGLGAMGFGIPAAVGVCLASNKQEVICIDGDGGFFMNIQELEVVKRLNLPIKFFVLNNNGYGSIKSTQDNYFNSHYAGCNPESGLTLPDIQMIATAFGIHYCKINNSDMLLKKLTLVYDTVGSVICEVMINKDHITLPRTTVHKLENGSFEAAPMHMMKPELPPLELATNIIVSEKYYGLLNGKL
jgi:acetolactate synthase-1/2/3 large subunit